MGKQNKKAAAQPAARLQRASKPSSGNAAKVVGAKVHYQRARKKKNSADYRERKRERMKAAGDAESVTGDVTAPKTVSLEERVAALEARVQML